MSRGTARSSGQASAPLNAVWESTARASDFLVDGVLVAERTTGPADRIGLTSGDGRAWHGFLRLLDEDAVDRVRHYRLTARSTGDRLSADLTVQLASDRADASRVDVECTLRSTTDGCPDPRELVGSWLDAIRRYAPTWAREAAPADQSGHARLGAINEPSQVARTLAPWTSAGLGLVLGLATGAALGRLGDRRERNRP